MLGQSSSLKNIEENQVDELKDFWSVWSCGHDYCHDYRHDRNSVHKKKTKVDHNYQSLWTRPYYSLLLFRFILF
ncbi:hypothetical protein V6Z11_D02G087500 [Gossypium hirsutum]